MTPTVVYIDDEPLLCRAFRSLLQLHGVDCVTFTSPREGLTFLLANEPAIVFCDYRMHEMNAIELLSQLPRDVPFYIVSGDLDVERLVAAHPRVTGVLNKPFGAERLVELLDAHVPGRRDAGS